MADSIFNAFALKFQMVRQHYPHLEELSELGDFERAVVCPLCNHVLGETALLVTNHPKQLTVEHNPPESVGGKPSILLCKSCNNSAGKSIDKALLDYFETQPFINRTIGATVPVKAYIESKGKKFSAWGRWEREAEKRWFIKFHLNDKDYYRKDVLNNAGADYKLTLSGKFPSKQHVQIALLKIAYLTAFQTFGHTFIISGDHKAIRSQIANPTQRILPNCGSIITGEMFPYAPGIFMVPAPKQFRGYMVVFDIAHNGLSERFAVMLPGPSINDLRFYHNIDEFQGKPFTVENVRRFRDLDYLTHAGNVTAATAEFHLR